MIDRTPKAGEFYRHFKNKLYKIVAIANHSETGEALVIYQALYGTFGTYARPLDMFVSEVDHAKYPEVTQKYRFERVNISQTADGSVIVASAEPAAMAQSVESVATTIVEPAVDPKLMEFLDADTLDEKYNVLVSMRDTITDKLIDDIAVVMDVVIPEGELTKRYDSLKSAIRTRQHYEFSNRLR